MKGFFETKSLAEAKQIALAKVQALSETEQIETQSALGRILAQDVCSPVDLPGFDRAGMDGYAVKAADTFKASYENPIELRVIGRVAMGQEPASLPALKPGEAVEIATGGAMPKGADAVVILEHTERAGSLPQKILIFSPVAPGAHVIAKDEDLKKGELVFQKGHRLRAQDIGALLAVGITSITVFRKVLVGVLATGDELVPADQTPKPGQVRDINSFTLKAQIEELGAAAKLYGIIPDEKTKLLAATRRALAENDLVLISGGSSIGARDATLEILKELGEVFVHGIRIAPGKPTIFAVCDNKPVSGLPGNPISSIVVFEKFVAPLVRKLSGAREWEISKPLVRAVLAQNIASAKGREDFVRVKLVERDGRVYAQPVYSHTNNISGLAKADGLIRISAESEGLEQGSEVFVELW